MASFMWRGSFLLGSILFGLMGYAHAQERKNAVQPEEPEKILANAA